MSWSTIFNTSIYDGILHSSSDYIILLDADGSMPPETILKLINKQLKIKQVIIEFVKEGV